MRVCAMWLALTYVYASAAGAAGLAGCVHGGHHGTVHITDVPGHAHAQDHAQDQPEGHAVRPAHHACVGSHDAGVDDADRDDGTSLDPCGCLGDCSLGAASAELPRCEAILPVAALDRNPAVPGSSALSLPSAEYVLPYPNAPPLS